MENNNSLYERLKQGLEDVAAYKRGEDVGAVVYKVKVPTVENVNVKAIRTGLGLTQEQFTKFGFSLSAIRHWEANRRKPEGSARILLKLIEKDPEAVLDVLRAA